MSTTQRHSSKNQLASSMPGTTERVILPRKPKTNTHTSVSRDDLEDDIECGESHRLGLIVVRLADGDEEHGQRDPPQVMAELGAELMVHEVAA